MNVCYFGELDPYTGSFRAMASELPRLVHVLKRLLLLHDVVIIPPGSLLEHPLALPALEHLAPFVRAGRLGTSADISAAPPVQYFEDRAQRAMQHLDGTATTRRNVTWHQTSVAGLVERWAQILPDSWSVFRRLPRQISGFLDEVRLNSEELARAGRTEIALAIRDFLDRRDSEGQATTRDAVLAFVAAQRGRVAPADIAHAAALSQRAYIACGAHFQTVGHGPMDGCVVFAGPFSKRLRSIGAAMKSPTGIPWNSAILGVFKPYLDRLLAESPSRLAALVETPEWMAIARALRGSPIPPETMRAIQDVLARRSLHGAIPAIAQLLAPTLLMPPWQGAALATLTGGSAVYAPADSVQGPPGVIIDWIRRVIQPVGSADARPISHRNLQLLSLLALSGETGMSTLDLMAALTELDSLGDGAFAHQRRPQPGTLQYDALEKRLSVYQSGLNALLKSSGLRVRQRHGRWCLSHPNRLLFASTPWDGPLTHPAPAAIPPGLSKQLTQLWRLLVRVHPGEVSLTAITETLTPDDRSATKAAANAMHRLGKRLTMSNEPVEIIGDKAGSYRLKTSEGHP